MNGRLAIVFDLNRPDTTGAYFLRACRTLGIPADHYQLRDGDRIPAGYALYLRIDHGDYGQAWPSRLRPAAFYAIDTHLPNSWKRIRRQAAAYDLVCCAQRRGADALRDALWVPLGCDLELHGGGPYPPEHDIAFIGTDGGVPRKFLLEALREEFPSHFIGHAPHTELGRLYGRSRIGINFAIRDDVNMRVFEVLCSGALLMTNALPGGDFDRMGLHDRTHLVCYNRPVELFELVRHYLGREDDRRRIAAAGQRAAQAEHTYGHRLRRILEEASRRFGLSFSSATHHQDGP